MPVPIEDAHLLRTHGDYHYERQDAWMCAHGARALPVLRIRFSDPRGTLAHINPATGDLVLSLDRSQRAGRWLLNLLPSWDLFAMLDAGPARVATLILLSLESMAIDLTGCVIGYRRLWMQLGKQKAS